MSAETPPPAGSPALLRAARTLLGPLVRLLLEHQITFPVLSNLLKTVYIEEADKHFGLPDRSQTISRLTLLTGIHRKDVKRLREEAKGEAAPPTTVSLGAQLVARWTAEPAYQDEAGRPRALPRLAGDRRTESFESLVTSATQDIRPRAVLDEWIRLGVATLDSDDHVHLAEDAFVPSQGLEEKSYYLGRNVRDHLAAAGHNIAERGAPMLERSVYYAKLRKKSAAELEALAREVGLDAIQTVNRRARALQQQDEGDRSATYRMSFGAWFFRGDEIDAQEKADPGVDTDTGGVDAD